MAELSFPPFLSSFVRACLTNIHRNHQLRQVLLRTHFSCVSSSFDLWIFPRCGPSVFFPSSASDLPARNRRLLPNMLENISRSNFITKYSYFGKLTLIKFLAVSSSPDANAPSIGPLSSSPSIKKKRFFTSKCFVSSKLTALNAMHFVWGDRK